MAKGNSSAAAPKGDNKSSSNAFPSESSSDGTKTLNPWMRFAVCIVTFTLSVPILRVSIGLILDRTHHCENVLHLSSLQQGIITAGIVIFITTFIIILLFILRKGGLMCSVLGFLLVSLLSVVMIILGLNFTGTMAKFNIAASPKLLSSKVYDENHWGKIKQCFYNTKVCDVSKPSPIQSGCCIPPDVTCDNVDVYSGRSWGKNDTAACDTKECDCYKWQNDRSTLCYDCFSCKQGFLKELSHKWVKLGRYLIWTAVLLLVGHLLFFVASVRQHHNK